MTEKGDDRIAYQVPPVVFYLMLAGSAGLGAGGMGILSPQLQDEAIRACMDNSHTAIRVAAQHGQELNELRSLIYQRTADAYPTGTARDVHAQINERALVQEKRLEAIERTLDRLVREK